MWFFGLIVVLLIGAVAVVASGRWGAMSTAYDDRPDMTVPARQALTSTDIESARFAVGVRGYRMDEVDTLLERVAKEVAERDRRIADLERAVAPIVEAPDGHGFSSRPYDPAEFEDTGTQPPILVGGPDPVARTGPADQSADSTGVCRFQVLLRRGSRRRTTSRRRLSCRGRSMRLPRSTSACRPRPAPYWKPSPNR